MGRACRLPCQYDQCASMQCCCCCCCFCCRCCCCCYPAVAAHVEPIVAWATAVWEQWLPRRALLTLAADARKRLVAAAVIWSAVRGPGAAFVATATRLGWVIHDALAATTDIGEMVMLNRDPPRRIRELVIQSVQRWRCRAMEARLPQLLAVVPGTTHSQPRCDHVFPGTTHSQPRCDAAGASAVGPFL